MVRKPEHSMQLWLCRLVRLNHQIHRLKVKVMLHMQVQLKNVIDHKVRQTAACFIVPKLAYLAHALPHPSSMHARSITLTAGIIEQRLLRAHGLSVCLVQVQIRVEAHIEQGASR
jgi:hypothetical protein